jgi:MYXO-CTERM domain-containing protein
MTKLRLASLIAGSALAFSVPFLIPSQAEACGGTFCDGGPNTMPVDQTGENILFKIGADFVEAHIQIQIDPDTPADQFAWVIPVTAVPEFAVGSQIFFDNMLNGSVPNYGVNTNFDFCGDGGDDGLNGGDGADTGAGESGVPGDGDPEEPAGPDIVFQGSVGAFEIAVLDGGTVEGVMTWLGDNGYQQDPAAEPILAQYLEEEFLFVALKLGVESGVSDVHPIVIRYSGTEPCVPIRLTRIAAQDDMDIRAFFLGDARVVPVNYRHVLINSLKLDWFNFAANYKEVISVAVDAQEADGNAFVTEYAGTSSVVSMAGVYDPAWDAAEYAALVDSPVGVVDLLTTDNLIFCDTDWDFTCTTFHPLLQGILDQFVPVPDGVDPVEFYDCMECYVDQIDLLAWDAAAFSAMIDERIFKPGQRAFDLVQANPYLTRMYTTISPSEMNADPIFRSNASLPEVPAQRIATQTTHCDGSTTVELPDGRQVYFPAGEPLVWPEFQDEMPWDEDIDQDGMADDAPLINLVDNTDKIDELLEEYNDRRREEAGADGGTDAGLDDSGLGAGCGCSSTDDDPARGALLGFAALGLLGFLRRRKG